MEKIKTFFKSNVTDNDHSIYKMFLHYLIDDNTAIIQKSFNSFILLNEKKKQCMIINAKIIEIVKNDNIIMLIPHEYIREKITQRIYKEVEIKVNRAYERVRIYKLNSLKKLL